MSDLAKINMTDLYKYGHYRQYKPGIEYVSSYIESRGVESGRDWQVVVNAGVSNFVENFLSTPLVTAKSLEKAKSRIPATGLSFNTEGFEQLLKIHNGMAPVRVEALPEGMVVPLGTAQMQLVNTDRRFPWVTSFLETAALRGIWYPSTVGTQSFHLKRIIARYMDETAGHREGLDFKLHDFGA